MSEQTTEEMQEELAQLWAEFKANGGRGVELADRIDELQKAVGERA